MHDADFFCSTKTTMTSRDITKTQTSDPANSDPNIQTLQKDLISSHAMLIGNSQKGARYLSSLVYCCHVDQTVSFWHLSLKSLNFWVLRSEFL